MHSKYELPSYNITVFEVNPENTNEMICSYVYDDGTTLTGYGKNNIDAFEDMYTQYRGLLALLAPSGFP